MKDKVLLGIDVGTSVIKAILLDGEGRELGTSRRRVPVSSPQPGWMEQDMHVVWRATAAVIRAILKRSEVTPADVLAIGVAGQGDGAWMVDETGRPVRAAPLWSDNRAAGYIDQWRNDGTLEACFRSGGTVLWPGSQAAILAWLRDHEPQAYRDIRWVYCCKDWINYQLTGVVCTDESDGSIPFSAIERRAYDETLLDLLGFLDQKDHLPPIRESHQIIGRVTKEAGKSTGLVPGAPVVAGSVDVIANAIGAGVIEPGGSLLILGTTAVNAVVMDRPDLEPANVGATVCHAVPGRWLRALGSLAGTPNIDWFIQAIGVPRGSRKSRESVYDACSRLIGGSAPGAGGIVYHPFLRGERAPFLQPAACASFFGISQATSRLDLLRAVYEGVALSLRDCYERTGRKVDQATLSGGGAQSAFWCQMLADVTGREIAVPAGAEFGAKGAALLAGIGAGRYADCQDAVRRTVVIERSYTPDPRVKGRYDDLYGLYRGLYESFEPFWLARQAMRHPQTDGGQGL